MFPEDRVLVGVINRKRDLLYARDEHWYRIPQDRMPQGIHAEYLAFFLSGKVFKELSGGIHFFASVVGLELAYRRDMLPQQPNHPHANHVYYRVALDSFQEKHPPILNTEKRPISFIYTTWDRFIHAATIRDLYSTADYFVDRIYHALRNTGINPQHVWEAEKGQFTFAPGLRVLCENGTVEASTRPSEGVLYIDMSQPEDKVLANLRAEIAKRGGPVTISIPMEGI